MRELALRQAAGRIPEGELPMAAAELPAAGEDSPALRDPAGRSGRERAPELAELLGQA
ncbi:hypothetical protein ACFC6L_33345 [Kitasatospora phosalacinea]|uniref:hypothetical protein n=1 Tax=Kitasatospora phosalacinea TaxID=2065 RepID=UPI0035E036DB